MHSTYYLSKWLQRRTSNLWQRTQLCSSRNWKTNVSSCAEHQLKLIRVQEIYFLLGGEMAVMMVALPCTISAWSALQSTPFTGKAFQYREQLSLTSNTSGIVYYAHTYGDNITSQRVCTQVGYRCMLIWNCATLTVCLGSTKFWSLCWGFRQIKSPEIDLKVVRVIKMTSIWRSEIICPSRPKNMVKLSTQSAK